MHNSLRRLAIICLVAMVGAFGCTRPDAKATQTFLDKLSHAPESELAGLLYGFAQSSPGAQQVLLGMLRPLRAPNPHQHITLEAARQSGRFMMLVVRVPWAGGSQPGGLQPIIITGEAGNEQIVGYVLPFNDIFPLVKGADMQSVSELSQWWVQQYGQGGRAGV